MNGSSSSIPHINQTSQTSPSGFVAVNARPHHDSNGNGTSSTTRHDLLNKFHTLNERRPSSQPPSGSMDIGRPSVGAHGLSHPSTPMPNVSRAPSKPVEALAQPLPRPTPLNESELQSLMNSPVPIPNTPSNLLPAASQRATHSQEKDDGGPFKAEMVHRMESLAKGERILPPCDRCRRLHMDCLKNLTACMGCTKKHAKCSWKDVREPELRGGYAHPIGSNSGGHSETSDHEGDRASTASPAMLSPALPGLQVVNGSHNSGNGHLTPQPPSYHLPLGLPHDSRLPPTRNSPPDRERERERHVEAQLQEAAQSSLAHANSRLDAGDGKGGEYQTMVV